MLLLFLFFCVSVIPQCFTRNIQYTSTKLAGILICRPPEHIKLDFHDSNSLPVALRMGWPLRSPQMWASGRCNSAKISSYILSYLFKILWSIPSLSGTITSHLKSNFHTGQLCLYPNKSASRNRLHLPTSLELMAKALFLTEYLSSKGGDVHWEREREREKCRVIEQRKRVK